MDLLPADTSPEVGARAAAVAVLPVGSLEQHGPHLPLTTDTVVAATLAARVAEAHPVRLLPPVTFSCSHEHAAWPGTVSLSATTLVAVVHDVAASLLRDGVRSLVLVNGHGGNHVLANVVQEASLGPLPMALFAQPHDRVAARVAAGLDTSEDADMHAGELETSILLHFHPHLVRPDWARADHDAEHRPHLLSRGLREYSESGVVGRPSRASAEKGRAVVESLVSSFGAYL